MAIPTFNNLTSMGDVRTKSLNPTIEAVNALETSVTGKANSGNNSDIKSITGLTTPLALNQGGTGSATKNFVDLTTAQTVAGVKTFSSVPKVGTADLIRSTDTSFVSTALNDATIRGLAGLLGFNKAPITSSNWDNITETGFYGTASNTQPELPIQGAGQFVFHIATTLYTTQMSFRSNATTPSLFRRSKDTSGWGAWKSVLFSGDFGLGGPAANLGWNAIGTTSAFNSALGNTGATWLPSNLAVYGINVSSHTGSSYGFQVAGRGGYGMYHRALENGTYSSWAKVYDTVNTTVDTNNFIKVASPIARLTSDVSKMGSDFDGSVHHMISGLVSTNEEAEGVSATREGVGVYKITGSVGMAKEGWTIEIPQDINRNPLCFVNPPEVDEDGTITISVFKRKFDFEAVAIVAGDPMDIPEGRWIDLRLEMPEDSIWNLKQKELEEAAEEEAARLAREQEEFQE